VDLRLLNEGQQFSTPIGEMVLWQNLLSGDKKALASIYTRYFDPLYNYGIKISSDTVIVEDAIQDLFIEIWNRRGGLNKEVKSIKHYLYTCLRRKIILKINQQHNTIDIDKIASFDIALSDKSHYLNNQLNTELRQKLIEVIGTLSPKQKEALFLIYFEELSYEEVAVIMSLKIKTVYNLIHQAISRLKDRRHNLWHLISFLF
jgi:RNA polymerase sigma factor (sigma-70 family)